jgi:iron complex outermembrane receptor protein
MSMSNVFRPRPLTGQASLAALSVALSTVGWNSAATAQNAGEEKLEEVIVSGIRESLRGSAEIKRNSLEVVDSITAEDIGKLPDANVAETMTRIPGVQGYRYGGEGASPVGVGSGLTIRGLSGQTASHVDGRSYFTAGNREFNIEGAIPGMIAGIDVYKNPSAEHIEGGIGGVVNIRTRRPLDFEGMTISAAANARYNDLSESAEPDVFGLYSNRWDVGDGGEFGFLIAANVQESHNRSDSNPGNGGTNLRRAIRADSAEYATTAGANQAYAGRSDVWHLADAGDPLALTPAQRADLITATTQQAPVFEEDILRTRRGFSAAMQWMPSDSLELYAESNYNYYLYHQEYRFLFANDTRTVQGLATSPYELTEGLANRNSNGGADEVLSGQRLDGGTFLDATLNSTGGDEDHPYETAVYATGFKWQAAENLDVDFDVAYVTAEQKVDNRSVGMVSAPGLTWDISRNLTSEPHDIGFSGGPALDDPSTWMLNNFDNGNRAKWEDDGWATTLDLTYRLDTPVLSAIKVGARWAIQDAEFFNYSFSGRPLTTNGLPLAADRSNGVPLTAVNDLGQIAPRNWMDGEAGFSGGYYVFAPADLPGNTVRDRFPLANIPDDGALPENLLQRRKSREETLAGYVQGEFAFLNERIKGNLGVRVVRTDLSATAMVADIPGPGISPRSDEASQTDTLPSLNIVGLITDNLQLRFGYGKALTRPSLADLNPSLGVNTIGGTATRGNPDLEPLKADSYDLSLEWYFSEGGYLAAGIFDKEIEGFFTGISECESIAGVPAYTGSQQNGCTGGQYFVTRTVNAEDGYARGAELSGQTFFTFLPGIWSNFGVQGSYSHVETENPVRFTTNGPLFDVSQAFQSDDSYSIAGLYEDDRLSARLVYTYRSDFVLFGVSANPIDGRYVEGYGIVDFSLGYSLGENFDVSATVSNLTNEAPDRFVGEPGAYATDFERQHFMNGRIFGIGVRYGFGR